MALLTWATTYVTPLYVAGAKGRPVATTASPSVQVIRSAGFASDCAGGFDNAKMIGRSVCYAISLTIASVKLPETVDASISMVGETRRTTSSRLNPFPGKSCFQLLLSAGDRAYV